MNGTAIIPLCLSSPFPSVSLLGSFVSVLSSGKLFLALFLRCIYLGDPLDPYTPKVERSQMPCIPQTL